MLDKPDGGAILAAVAKLLRETLMPRLPADVVFQARVAANALDLVSREITSGAAAEDQAKARLVSILGQQGSLADLESMLSAQIKDGRLAADDPALQHHLWETTLAKMAIDQPTYASYRRELELRATESQRQYKE